MRTKMTLRKAPLIGGLVITVVRICRPHETKHTILQIEMKVITFHDNLIKTSYNQIMANTKQQFTINGEKVPHLHLNEIPAKFIRKDTPAQKYRDDVLRTLQSLQYTYGKLITSAQICYLNIDSITNSKPYMPSPNKVYESVRDFVYHYENYAVRIFVLREKSLHFINAALPVEWPEHDVRVATMLNHTTVKKAKLHGLIKKFDANSTNPLGNLVKNRNQLTHKLYYANIDHYLRPTLAAEIDDEDEDALKDWLNQWKRRIKDKEEIVTGAQKELSYLNHELSEKVYIFRSNKAK